MALAVVVVMGLLGAMGCGGEKAGDPARPVRVVEDSLKPLTDDTGWKLQAMDWGPSSATLRLAWQGSLPTPGQSPVAPLTLPPGLTVATRLEAAQRGTQTFTIDRPTTPGWPSASGVLRPDLAETQFAGFVRGWPIYRLEVRDELFTTVRGATPDAPDVIDPTADVQDAPLELTFGLSWPGGLPAVTTNTTAASSGRAAWTELASKLVLNPGDLARCEQWPPPLKADAAGTPSDPRAGAPGAQHWARLDITTTGLVRLDPQRLLTAGFPARELRDDALRVFSLGEAVPLMVAPGPELPAGWPEGVYFWATGGRGDYSPARVYWITLASALPPRTLPELGAPEDTVAGTPRPLETVRRLARAERDTRLHTRHGSFLAIEEMRWIDDELEAGTPFMVPLRLPGYDAARAAASPMQRLTLDFMLDRPQGFANVQCQVAVEGGPVLGQVNFASDQDGNKTLDLPATALRDGALTLTLTLQDPSVTTGSTSFGSGVLFDAAALHYPGHPALDNGRLRLVAADLLVQPDAATSGTSATIKAAPAWLPVGELRDRATGAALDPARLLALKLDALQRPLGRIALTSATAGGEPGIGFALAGEEALTVLTPEAVIEANLPAPVHFDDILSAPEQPVDLLLIHHADLREAAELWAKHREATTAAAGRAWRIRLVDVQAIYDRFNHGELSPEAIKQYLRYTLEHWGTTAPAATLLLGDASSDFLDVARKGVRNWVPTYSYHSGPETWGSDYWMTTLAGDDDLGDMLIGRIPAASREDAAAMLANIIGYDQAPRAGPWRARIGFVSDDGEFPAVVDELRRTATPAAFEGRRMFLGEQPLEDNWYLPRSFVESKRMKVSRAATMGILEMFRGGTTFLTYYGHGSPNIWADERIWFGGDSKNSDNLHLAESGYRTFVANMTCNSGAIDYPLPPWNICITEDMLRVKDGGAVACYVPTGPGVTTLHQRMSEALHRALFRDGERRLGPLTQLARLRYTLARNSTDLTYMYLLLGDPLSELQMTRDLYRFALEPKAAMPGGKIELDLREVPLRAGQWQIELVDANERMLWRGAEEGFDGARLRRTIDLPTTATLGEATVRVYAWEPGSGRDFAAAASLEVTRPWLQLGELTLGAGKGATVRAAISNPGALAATGELEWLALEQAGDRTTSRSLGRETIELAPGGSTDASLKLPGAAPAGPLVIEARLSLPQAPPNLEMPALQSARTLAAAPAGWWGLVPALSQVTPTATETAQLRLTAAAGAADTTLSLQTGFVDLYGATWSTQTLRLAAAGSAPRKTEIQMALDGSALNRVRAQGGVWLHEYEGTTSTSLPWGALPERRPELRIVEDSLRVYPTSPTEGDTIFVEGLVENVGTQMTDGGSAGLYTQPPQMGGRMLDVSMGEPLMRLPRLAPGQRAPFKLRWDPLHNAGEQTFHVALAEGFGQTRIGGPAPPSSPPLTVQVRTRPKLATVRTWTEATEQELAVSRMRLKAEIENTGETDAERIMLSFYRSALQTPDNKLGEVELARVPAGGKVEAEFTWKYDPQHDYVAGTTLPEPTVQIWLKGSSQRISSVRKE